MIKDMVNHPADSTARCEEAYAKAQKLQDKLNAVITFVDPKEQLMMRQSQRNYVKQVQYVLRRHLWMNSQWVAQT